MVGIGLVGWPLPTGARKSKAAKRPPEDKGAPHAPFEEFSVKELDRLVGELEKSKPKDAKVEVSAMEESHHSPCMQEMQAIVVQSNDVEGQLLQTYSMYQYCPACKIAVRVL